MEIAARETADKIEIAFHEIEGGQQPQIDPTDLFEHAGARLSAEPEHVEEKQVDAASARVIVLIPGKFAADTGAYPQLLPELPNQGLLRTLALLHFAAWELPFKRVPVALSPLADENVTLPVNDAR